MENPENPIINRPLEETCHPFVVRSGPKMCHPLDGVVFFGQKLPFDVTWPDAARARRHGKRSIGSWENWLVVWHITFIFPSIGNVIIPIDFHIFQRGSNHQPDFCLILRIGFPPRNPRKASFVRWYTKRSNSPRTGDGLAYGEYPGACPPQNGAFDVGTS